MQFRQVLAFFAFGWAFGAIGQGSDRCGPWTTVRAGPGMGSSNRRQFASRLLPRRTREQDWGLVRRRHAGVQRGAVAEASVDGGRRARRYRVRRSVTWSRRGWSSGMMDETSGVVRGRMAGSQSSATRMAKWRRTSRSTATGLRSRSGATRGELPSTGHPGADPPDVDSTSEGAAGPALP